MRRFVLLNAALLILLVDPASTQNGLICDCGNSPDQPTLCLTETQMGHHLKYIEMAPDRMGNQVNVSGIAVFELTVGKDGRIVNAKAISGHPLAFPLLIGAMDKWRFRPLLRNKTARQMCGRLSVKFTMIPNLSKVAVVSP